MVSPQAVGLRRVIHQVLGWIPRGWLSASPAGWLAAFLRHAGHADLGQSPANELDAAGREGELHVHFAQAFEQSRDRRWVSMYRL